jgi:hypothetical protein
VTEVLYDDVLKVFVYKPSIDLYAYVADDYLDETRKLTPKESRALDVRIVHDLMSLQDPKPLSKEELSDYIREMQATSSSSSDSQSITDSQKLSEIDEKSEFNDYGSSAKQMEESRKPNPFAHLEKKKTILTKSKPTE